MINENYNADFLRNLLSTLDKPTPLSVKDEKHLTDMSIMRQSLLFSERKASVSAYKVSD